MKHKKRLIVAVVLGLVLVLGCAVGIGFLLPRQTDTPATLGVWWWNKNLDVQTYLPFAKNHGVTEIYFCDSAFDDGTAALIREAHRKDIQVYWLAGEYQWLRDDSGLRAQIARYQTYQVQNAAAAFDGVHLDIEPHQDPQFAAERVQLIQSLVALVQTLAVSYPDIDFDYDIPFWLDDVITYDGTPLAAYAHIINYAHRVFIMSYRDTADAIYDTAQDEIAYAQTVGKTLVLGVETYSTEGDHVSFAEEGQQAMYAAIDALRRKIPSTFGVAIHQIKTWYDLQE